MRFQVLGPLVVSADGQAIGIRQFKWRTLLAVLLRQANRPVSADLLIDALWGERPPRSARTNLRVYVHRLRQVMDNEERISWIAPGYALTIHPGELDTDRFAELVGRARQASEAGDTAVADTMLREALGLWRGSAYEGLIDECPLLHDEAARLEELRLTALQDRLAIDLDLGRHGDIVPELRTLVAEHPLRERFRAQLMIALYRSGRQAEALQVYRDTWQILTEELGIAPSPQLRELEQAILTDAPSLNAPDAPSPTARHPVVPQQLPPDVSGFTGRHDELAQLDALLPETGEHSTTAAIGSVAGTAGVGKTALVVHWAHRVRDHFPDGVLFADLRGYDPTGLPARPVEVLERFLRALEVPPAAIPATLDERAALFRTQLSRRRMLVVLDNAATSEQVRWLLPGSAGCPVIVTSRSRLSALVARFGARRIPLGLLSQSEATTLVRRLLPPARVNAEPVATSELAKLCVNLPLALRLAAERISARPHLTLTDLIQELANERDRLNLLTADDDITAVRAALSWSYRDLDSDTARAFRLLGLHPGPDMSLAAVSALIGIGEHRARGLLHTLTDVHLLQETSRDRYQLHDLLRAYALERAEADDPARERDDAVCRVLDWYLHTADAADRILMPQRRHVPLDPPQPATRPPEMTSFSAALRWCEAERLNLLAATQYAAEIGRYDIAWKLPCSLWSYFNVRSRWSDWLSTHEIGIIAARRGNDKYGESLLLTGIANAYREVHRYNDAFDRFDQAIAVSRHIGESWVEAAACTLLSIAHRDLSQFDEARFHCQQALRLFRANGDPWGTAWALYTLGKICDDLRRHDQAIEPVQQALDLFSSTDDQWGKGRALILLGQVYRNLQHFTKATEYCRKALAITHEIGNRHGSALALYTLGKIQFDIGRNEAARESWRRALSIFEQLGAPQAAKARARLSKLPDMQ
jgi:DNA-binding SARP family transcriptional activator